MRLIDPRSFRAERPWGALEVAELAHATVRLHWTDQPYRWHVNEGEEVFVVLAGEVEMRGRAGGRETALRLGPGDICQIGAGEAHCATPLGEARILVIERKGSP